MVKRREKAKNLNSKEFMNSKTTDYFAVNDDIKADSCSDVY